MAIEIGKPVTHGLEEVRRGAANIRDVIRRAREFALATREGGGVVRYPAFGCRGADIAMEQSGGDSGGKNRAGFGLWKHRDLEARARCHSHCARRF